MGYITHIGTDVTGQAFVNAISGGPFRQHWQRCYLVGNHLDAFWYIKDYLGPKSGDQYPQLTGIGPPSHEEVAGLLPPTAMNARTIALEQLPTECRSPSLKLRERFFRGCDPLRIAFHATAKDLQPHEAQVLRIRQKVGSDIVVWLLCRAYEAMSPNRHTLGRAG